MSAQSSFNGFVRTLQKFLAQHGFVRGTGRTFLRHSPEGDAVIIELQTSAGSDKTERAFYINVAFTLAPRWAMDRQRHNLPDTAQPTHEYGIWRHRIGFTSYSGGDTWRIRDDTTAEAVWQQVRRRLDEALPDLLQLVDRQRVRTLAEEGEFFGHASWQVRAWLLAENGPSAELEDLLFTQRPADTHNSAVTRGIVAHADRCGSSATVNGAAP